MRYSGYSRACGTPGTHAHAFDLRALPRVHRVRPHKAQVHACEHSQCHSGARLRALTVPLRCTPASTHSTAQVHACEYSQYRSGARLRVLTVPLRCTPASTHSTTQVHAREYVRHKALREATRQVTPQCRTLQPCNAACCIRTKPAVAAAALDAHDDAAATQRSRAYGPRRTRWHSAVSGPARRHDSAIIVQRVGAALDLPGGRARLSGPRLNRV